MGFKLHINSYANEAYTKKLKNLSNSALPIVVRQTLNDVAFSLKKSEMPQTAKATFKERSKNFFRANSKAEPAQGMDIKTMQSAVGFYENKLKIKATNYAVKDLEQQEDSGSIGGKGFIPLDKARNGGKNSGLVKNNARITTLRKNGVFNSLIHAKNTSLAPTGIGHKTMKRITVNNKQAFIRAAFMAKKINGMNAYVMSSSGGKEVLSKIESVFSNLGSKSLKINYTKLYSHKKGRNISVHATHFMNIASYEAYTKMDKYFVKNAMVRFKKYGVL